MTAEENFLLTVASHLEHRPLKKATKEEMRTVFSINRFPIDSIFFQTIFNRYAILPQRTSLLLHGVR